MADVTKIDKFIQSSPHPAWLATTLGHCVYSNPALERLTGLNSDQINQADWRSFLLEEDRAVASASWQRSLATGTPYRAQVRMRVGDGTPECVELVAFGHKTGDGPELWLFNALEANGVAAQKRPELEALIQATLNVIPAYTWYALPSGALTFVNERTANYLGLPKDHPLRLGIDTGAEWDSHTALLHPDDREGARKVWSTCLTTGTAGEFTFRVPSAEGKYRWFLTRAEPLRANDGTLLYWIGVNLDIDDAKRAEDALRKSEKELRDVIDTIPAIVWSALPDGSNTYVNKRFVEYSGLSAKQTGGSGWQAAIHPDDLERQVGKWIEAVATGKPHENEVRFRRADGQYRWHLDRGVPLRDEDGNVVKWYGVTTDIEDRKRAEEALGLMSRDLQESKTRLEEAQRIAHVGHWAWDGNDGLTWSDETYRIYGLQPQERPMTVEAFQEMIHPEDRGILFRAIQEARGGGFPDIEYRIIHPSGEVRIVHAVTRDMSGQPYQMFGIVQDITDRKRAEKALEVLSRDLQESKAKLEEAQRITHVGYWEWDIITGRVNLSDETYRIYGLRPQADPIDLATVRELVHPEDREAVFRTAEDAILRGVRYDSEHRLVRPNGEVCTVHALGDLKKDASGRPYQLFGTVQDITDRKTSEDKIRRLVDANILGVFIGNFEGAIIQANDAFLRMVQYGHEDVVSGRLRWTDLTPPEWRERDERAVAEVKATRTIQPYEKEYFRKDGSRVPVMIGSALFEGGNEGVVFVLDLSKQKRADEALRSSEAYLAEAQRLSHTGSWANAATGEPRYWSEECFRVLGFDPAEPLPSFETILQRIHPDDRPAMREQHDRGIRDKADFEADIRIVHPITGIRHIRSTAHAVLDQCGDLREMVGTVMDITEHKLLTQELERQQAHLTEAQKLTHTGSWAWRLADRKTVHLSEEWYRIYGFDPAEGSPTWEEYLERVHPEDRLRWKGIVEQAIVEKADYDQEFRILLPNGIVKWLRTVGHPVLSDAGDLEEFVGSSTDITERKSAEQALQRSEAYLAEAQKLTHTGSWAWRLADRTALHGIAVKEHLSDEWYRIYGFDPAEGSPTWEEYLECVHPDDRLNWKGMFERAIVEKADYEQEFRILLPNGMVKWIHTVGHPVLSNTGDLEGFVGSSTDITELKSAEQEREKLRQLEADLAHINRVSTLGEMSASLAHEIKQPIAAAITSANSCIAWLAHEPPNLDRARAAAARIDEYGNRAAEIIDRIRSFYKKSLPQRELVDVNGIIQEMLTLLKGEATRYSVAMRTDLSAELPNIMADRVQLQQVFMNLMLNGIEAMEDSGGDLTVKSQLEDGQLQFSVSDAGVGLPTEKMDQIFSAFFTTKPQGSGMGLAISRSIVESHGGRLWATANDGRGVTFHFTLPTHMTEASSQVNPVTLE